MRLPITYLSDVFWDAVGYMGKVIACSLQLHIRKVGEILKMGKDWQPKIYTFVGLGVFLLD